jgi:zinc and cadmium transporter
MVFINIIISSIVISLISLLGIVIFSLKTKILNRLTIYLVALSAGSLLSGAFLHLLPEAAETAPVSSLFNITLLSFILFFLIEKLIHWQHCHQINCAEHSFGYMSLIGDLIHNFIDGLIIAVSFISGTSIGLVSTLAIALHEIPQEIGDFAVLIHSGFSKKKALLLNFLISLTALLGAIIGYLFSVQTTAISSSLLPMAAGSFIYIAASDLIPEIRKHTESEKGITTFFFFILGILLMYLLGVLIKE